MRIDRLALALALIIIGTTTSCHKGSSQPGAVSESSAAAGPPSLCADLGTLIEAARQNFPNLRRQERPITIDNSPGFEATVALPDTLACRILTSEPPYPDAYECDLAPVESAAKAAAVIERWAPLVATCPQLATWTARPPTEFGRSWELDTNDDHQLMVRLFAAGDDHARPTLVIRLNEI